MMKNLPTLLFFFSFQLSYGQVELKADGAGNTYELITSVLAPNYNPIEAPDCNHDEFGEHIDEVFDNDFTAFFQRELQERHQFKYPPFYRVIKITLNRNHFSTIEKCLC